MSPATIVLIVSVLGLVFIGLVASAAFTVMAQRRQRALGMLASLGATEADVRFVLIVDGLVAGVLGAVLGGAVAARRSGSGTTRTWRPPPRTAPTPSACPGRP